MAAALGPMARRVYACRPKTHRAYDPEDVAAAFRPYAESSVVGPVRDAIDAALEAAGPDDPILITGPIFTPGGAPDPLPVRPSPGFGHSARFFPPVPPGRGAAPT